MYLFLFQNYEPNITRDGIFYAAYIGNKQISRCKRSYMQTYVFHGMFDLKKNNFIKCANNFIRHLGFQFLNDSRYKEHYLQNLHRKASTFEII